MSRLIDADALIQDLTKWMKQVDPTRPQEVNAIPPMEDIIVSTLMTIEEQPTIESECKTVSDEEWTQARGGWTNQPERKKGKWIDMGDFEQCSVCLGTRLKEVQTFYGKAIWIKTDFCPNCGADMRGDE